MLFMACCPKGNGHGLWGDNTRWPGLRSWATSASGGRHATGHLHQPSHDDCYCHWNTQLLPVMIALGGRQMVGEVHFGALFCSSHIMHGGSTVMQHVQYYVNIIRHYRVANDDYMHR